VKGVEGEELLVSLERPELAGELEASLVLGASRLDGPGAAWLAERLRGLVVHAVLVLPQVADLARDRLPRGAGEDGLQFLQAPDHVQRAVLAPFEP